MINDLLKEIGLSEKETLLYLNLLRHGQRPITFLSQKAGLNRGLAYVLLHALLEKGLVTKATKGRVQYFAALDPRNLINYLEHKKEQIAGQQERVQQALSQLAAIANPLTSKPRIRFFDGVDGARSALETIRKAKDKTLCAYLSVSDSDSLVGSDHFSAFIDRLTTDGYTLRVIRARASNDNDSGAAVKSLFEAPGSRWSVQHQVRNASHELIFPMTMFFFDDKAVLFSSKDENFALLIESREYSEMQRSLFELVWRSLERTTIRLGVLHSLSGTMAISERPMVDAILMAVDEINARGGLLGKSIDPVVLDGASDPQTFAQRAELLITKHQVASVIGGWTSASRKTMRPVFEKHRHLLWYPLQYEGLEQSPNIVYLGAAPNQQVLPAIDWAVKHLGRKFFLVGSDYVFPRSANEIMKGRIAELGASVVGEAYENLGSQSFHGVVKKIQKSHADVIINTINGDSNIAFFDALRDSGVTADRVPTISFSIAEEEISRMKPGVMTGDYAAWSYFQAVRSKENSVFVKNFQKKYGSHRLTSDPVQTAYSAVHLFAAAVVKAGTDDVSAIRDAARGLTLDSPEGNIRIDPDNRHTHRISRIGQLRENGQFKIVWDSETPLKPDPYPKYKSQREWELFLEELRLSWDGAWAKEK